MYLIRITRIKDFKVMHMQQYVQILTHLYCQGADNLSEQVRTGYNKLTGAFTKISFRRTCSKSIYFAIRSNKAIHLN